MERLFFPYTAKEAKKAGVDNCSEMNRNSVFASRMRDLRNEYEMSQAALAEELGIVKSTIGLYETGDTVPDARTLKKYAEFFDVSADWLLGLSDCTSIDANEKAASEYLGISHDLLSALRGAQQHGVFTNSELMVCDSETRMQVNRLETLLSMLVSDDGFLSDYVEMCQIIDETLRSVKAEDSKLTGETYVECDRIQFRRYMVQRAIMYFVDYATGFDRLKKAQQQRLFRGWDRIGIMNSRDDAWRAGYGE